MAGLLLGLFQSFILSIFLYTVLIDSSTLVAFDWQQLMEHRLFDQSTPLHTVLSGEKPLSFALDILHVGFYSEQL